MTLVVSEVGGGGGGGGGGDQRCEVYPVWRVATQRQLHSPLLHQ